METKFKANGVWKAAFQHFGESIGTWRSRIGPWIPAMPSWHRAIMASWHRGMLHGWWFTGFPISTPGCSTKWRQEGKHLKVTSDIKKQYYVPSWNHLQKLVSLDSLLLLKCNFFFNYYQYTFYIHLCNFLSFHCAWLALSFIGFASPAMLPRRQCQWRIHIRCDAARPWRTADQQLQIYQNTSKQTIAIDNWIQLISIDIVSIHIDSSCMFWKFAVWFHLTKCSFPEHKPNPSCVCT